jgi:hypothetical protein
VKTRPPSYTCKRTCARPQLTRAVRCRCNWDGKCYDCWPNSISVQLSFLHQARVYALDCAEGMQHVPGYRRSNSTSHGRQPHGCTDATADSTSNKTHTCTHSVLNEAVSSGAIPKAVDIRCLALCAVSYQHLPRARGIQVPCLSSWQAY